MIQPITDRMEEEKLFTLKIVYFLCSMNRINRNVAFQNFHSIEIASCCCCDSFIDFSFDQFWFFLMWISLRFDHFKVSTVKILRLWTFIIQTQHTEIDTAIRYTCTKNVDGQCYQSFRKIDLSNVCAQLEW